PYSRRRRWRVPEARAALDALAASGLSVSAFAEREGLDEERLYRWRRRFAREGKAEAHAVTPPATPAIIELRPSANLGTRRSIVSYLEGRRSSADALTRRHDTSCGG